MKRGQVWIETVIYTLIAFVLIGLVLAFISPKIQELQDRTVIQQSTEMMRQIDDTLLNMGDPGNQRTLQIGIKEGNLILDCVNNQIIFEIQSKNLYSEPGKNISDGSITVLTQQRTGYNLVTLTLDYSSQYNLQYSGSKIIKTVNPGSNPYTLTIINEGTDANGKIIMNMSL